MQPAAAARARRTGDSQGSGGAFQYCQRPAAPKADQYAMNAIASPLSTAALAQRRPDVNIRGALPDQTDSGARGEVPPGVYLSRRVSGHIRARARSFLPSGFNIAAVSWKGAPACVVREAPPPPAGSLLRSP
jgi:hypothetical protein